VRNLILSTLLIATAVHSFAQGPPGQSPEQQVAALNWLAPGSIGRVADKAEFKVTAAHSFLGAADTDTFLQINGNPPQGGRSYTIAPTKGNWFGILSFSPEGYVKDDEKIDPDALLKSLKEQNVLANEEKSKKGYPPLVLESWYFPPRYDTETKRLEWGTKLRAQDNSLLVNVSTKLLGRSGFTNAILVTSPETIDNDLVDFKKALKNFDYVGGERYSEWKSGDKVAAYGLGALVLGGAAAVAMSKGGLKALAIAILGGAVALWAGIKKFLGRKQ